MSRDIPSPPPDFNDHRFPSRPSDVEEFPRPPPTSTHDDEHTEFPDVPPILDDVQFPAVPSMEFPKPPSDEVDDLEARLKKLNPNTAFTSKQIKLDYVAEPSLSKAEQAEHLLKMYADEAKIESRRNPNKDSKNKNSSNNDDDEPAEEEDDAVVKSLLKSVEKDSRNKKQSNKNDDADLLLQHAQKALGSSASKNTQNARQIYDTRHAKANSKIARELLQEAAAAGIDPTSLDIHSHVMADSDNSDMSEDHDDDDDDDSIELSDDD